MSSSHWLVHVAPFSSWRVFYLPLFFRHERKVSALPLREEREKRRKMHRLPSPFLIVLSVLIFASSLCNALYGPSSPVVQLSPSNFKSKVTWLPLCSASSCLVGEKVVGEWKRTVNLELSYKEQENDSDDYLRKLIIFSSDRKLLKVLKYAALNWLQSAIFLFFFLVYCRSNMVFVSMFTFEF